MSTGRDIPHLDQADFSRETRSRKVNQSGSFR
jgi:hypothetical protein